MLRGLYTAATGMIHQRDKLNTIANNLSNTNTRGYKRDSVVSHSFRDELLLRTGGQAGGVKPLGPLNHGVYVERTVPLFEDGALEQTDLITDIALQGNGFFTILRDGEEFYTRDGTFKVDDEGFLVTMEGHTVDGEYGPIHVGQGNFDIDDEGNIWQDDGFVNSFRLVDFEDATMLDKVGDNLFVNNNPGANQALAFEGQVFQGYAEASNVELLEEMSNMIITSRAYEANQRVLQMIDSTLSKTVNEVGSL
ncbi:MAG TPA: flagellar hook-basal body complex protein [Clostridia bacterium]|nr:flagellar hook-basal body complex protein [Clostridia bacterium]